ncbi:threonine-phosphate decarboxylase [Megasphaera lornae]|uniref:threonine-phosphate decarboxylase n=1 Tax=Megasphaera lornae TaxID=1000568 RepID=A0ABN0D005_9FIRM|nr:threonine-phosphate decarboxylase [Megasphaera lornae]
MRSSPAGTEAGAGDDKKRSDSSEVRVLKQFAHGGNIYTCSQDGKKWLDFSANINPLGVAPGVRQVLEHRLDDIAVYPEPCGERVKQALAAHYEIPGAAILVGNGSTELLYTYFHTYPCRKTVLPVPSFSEYERAVRAVGGTPVYVYSRRRRSFAFPLAEVCKACERAECVIIGNPANPTGTLIEREQLMYVIQQAQKWHTDVLIDESFLDFLPTAEQYTVLDLPQRFEHVIVFRSLTHFYALPGLRLGFAVVSKRRAAAMQQHMYCWNVNILAQHAGIAALQETAYAEETRRVVAQEKQWLRRQLQALPGLETVKPTVNFILLHTSGTGKTAAELAAGLRERGILIRDGSNFAGLDPFTCRVAVKLRSENERLVQALESVI